MIYKYIFKSRHWRAVSVSVMWIGRRTSSACCTCRLRRFSSSSALNSASASSCSWRYFKCRFWIMPRTLATQSFQISQQNMIAFLKYAILTSSPSSTLLKTMPSTTSWSSMGNIVRFSVITSLPPFKTEKFIIFRRLFGSSLCLDARTGAVLQISDHCCSRLCLPHLLSARQPWKYPGRFIFRSSLQTGLTPDLFNRSNSTKIVSWGRLVAVWDSLYI